MNIKKSETGFSHLAILLIILLLGIIGFAGWRVYNNSKTNDKSQQATAPAVEVPAAEEKEGDCEAPEGYVSYINKEIGFCFAYPEEWDEVVLHNGVIDEDYEPEGSYRGSFSANDDASFGIIPTTWKYSGPGRGGPINATGFTKYEKLDYEGEGYNCVIKVNTITENLAACGEALNIGGAVVSAEKAFTDTQNYAGIQIQLNIQPKNGYDPLEDSPDELVTEAQYEQMQTILESVQEL